MSTKPKGQIWNVPFSRNPFFTAREDVLTALHNALQKGEAALGQPPAISGLGGVGKTQTAVEYAFRHRDEYAAVLWIAAESENTLISSLAGLAGELNLPEKDAQEQELAIAAVKKWLENHDDYLLILDNADNLPLARKYLPLNPRGHLIFTTRSRLMGGRTRLIALEKLSPAEGVHLLVNRSGRPVSEGSEPWRDALEISRELDGLPLALEQAAAYIETYTLSFAEYLKLYRDEGIHLLSKHASPEGLEHDSVTVTFSLAFTKLADVHPGAAGLLRILAFLASDKIPESIFTGQPGLVSKLTSAESNTGSAWAELVAHLTRHSLVQRDTSDGLLSIHRLVQCVLRDEMGGEERNRWCLLAIQCVNAAFPHVEFSNWTWCAELLPHGLAVIEHAAQDTMEPETLARLLNQIAHYQYERAEYKLAEPLFERALSIRERVQGAEHPSTATSLNNLASLYEGQGKLAEAEPLYKRALSIRERVLGAEHPDTATTLNNLSYLYFQQRRLREANQLLERALPILERTLGPTHPTTQLIDKNLMVLRSIRSTNSENSSE